MGATVNQEGSGACPVSLSSHPALLGCAPHARGWLAIRSLLVPILKSAPHMRVGGWYTPHARVCQQFVRPTCAWVVGGNEIGRCWRCDARKRDR